MATVLVTSAEMPEARQTIPPLQNGDCLTRAEFERRYGAMPEVVKAELIEGVVYMPSPVSFVRHGEPHGSAMWWLKSFAMLDAGVRCGDNSTVRLDLDNEPQPDVVAFLAPEAGGRARVDEDGYVAGAPELVVEVAASSVSMDLHQKLNAYRRNGVKEYVVWRVDDGVIDWFVLRGGAYEPLRVDSEGLYRSETFRGLVLDPAAMIAGDLRKVLSELTRAATAGDSGPNLPQAPHTGDGA